MITVYGASDDLIEVEGDIREEFGYTADEYSRDGNLLAFSDGTVLRIVFDSPWRITPVVRGTAALTVDQADDEGRTDRATLDGEIVWVVRGDVIARRGR